MTAPISIWFRAQRAPKLSLPVTNNGGCGPVTGREISDSIVVLLIIGSQTFV
jgi:hypothetical protein